MLKVVPDSHTQYTGNTMEMSAITYGLGTNYKKDKKNRISPPHPLSVILDPMLVESEALEPVAVEE